MNRLDVERTGDTYRWRPVSQAVADSYRVERSSDVGLTWSTVATIDNDATDASVFDAGRHRYYWVDAGAGDGQILRLVPLLGGDQVETYDWAYVYGPPLPVPTCNIFGIVLARDGTPQPNVEVTITPEGRSTMPTGAPGVLTAMTAVSSKPSRTVTDAEGRWQVTVAAGVRVRISIPAASVNQVIRVPRVAVLGLSDAYVSRAGTSDA
jgi:hypothetical protein